MLEHTDSKPAKALTLLTVAFYIESWSFPRDKILEALQEAHRAGMESGNIEMGFQNWQLCHLFAYESGYPLEPIESTGEELVEQLQLYNVDSVLSTMLESRLPVRYLLGKADKPLDWDELESFCGELGNTSETYRILIGYVGRLELAVIFGELEVAERMSEKLQPYAAHDSSYGLVTANLFYSALAFSGLARKTGSKIYASKATALSKKMKQISRTKGLNAFHKSLIMEADVMAFKCKKPDRLALAYEKGITAAVKMGYTQDAAIASEVAGEVFLSLGDEVRARQFLNQAGDLYLQVRSPLGLKSIACTVCHLNCMFSPVSSVGRDRQGRKSTN
jgi:hypothetical protein